MLTVAYGEIVPYNRGETLLCFATMIFGVFMYAALIGTLASLMETLDQQRVLYEQRHESITVAARSDQTSQLTQRIGDFYERFWRSARGTSPALLMQPLPHALQTEVCSFLYTEVLTRQPIFAGCKETFLLELSRGGQELLCMPGDYVARQGERSHEIYVILKGEIDVIRSSGENLRTSSIFDVARLSVGAAEEAAGGAEDEVARLQAGQSFGEVQMILETAYTASFCCKTYSVVLVLSRASLDAAFQRMPSMFTVIMSNAETTPDILSQGCSQGCGGSAASDVSSSRRLSSCAAAGSRTFQIENLRRRDEVPPVTAVTAVTSAG